MVFSILLAATGLTLSAVAIYYSVIGLTAVFAAAFWPIVVMGATLEIAKLVAASWLKMYWERIPKMMKFYMTTAVVVLMLITSMGIFGFLSKAHLDQNIVSGDVQNKIAIIDEKIQTERDNIDAARKALAQMDAQVNERLSRSTDDKGAERAVQIRRQQQTERTRLQNDISRAQSNIARLNEEAAPVRAEVRKVEAEVGPIKYIAKLIYGDNPDTNILEKAVTWVIMIIVFVFDPLAVLMLLSAQMTWQWRKENESLEKEMASDLYELSYPPSDSPVPEEKKSDPFDAGPWPFMASHLQSTPVPKEIKEDEIVEKELEIISEPTAEFDVEKHARSHIPEKEKELDIIEEVGVEQWNKMLEEAERAVEDEKERMRQWKEEHPESTIKAEQLKKAVGAIDEVPWNDEDLKKKISYMIKDHNRQIKKTKE